MQKLLFVVRVTWTNERELTIPLNWCIQWPQPIVSRASGERWRWVSPQKTRTWKDQQHALIQQQSVSFSIAIGAEARDPKMSHMPTVKTLKCSILLRTAESIEKLLFHSPSNDNVTMARNNANQYINKFGSHRQSTSRHWTDTQTWSRKCNLIYVPFVGAATTINNKMNETEHTFTVMHSSALRLYGALLTAILRHETFWVDESRSYVCRLRMNIVEKLKSSVDGLVSVHYKCLFPSPTLLGNKSVNDWSDDQCRP